jgi:hypothetical protein
MREYNAIASEAKQSKGLLRRYRFSHENFFTVRRGNNDQPTAAG